MTFIPANPHPLLDAVRAELKCPSDSALARRLGFSQMHITRIRGRYRPVHDELILSIHEETGWPIAKIKELRAASDPSRDEAYYKVYHVPARCGSCGRPFKEPK